MSRDSFLFFLVDMLQSVERDPHKFLTLLMILNSFFHVENDNKVFLYQNFNSSQIWNDLMMWKDAFKVIMKEKKQKFDELSGRGGSKNSGGGLLNPWKFVQNLQAVIVKKNTEEDEKREVMLKNESLELIKFYLSNLNLSLGYSIEILTLIAKE